MTPAWVWYQAQGIRVYLVPDSRHPREFGVRRMAFAWVWYHAQGIPVSLVPGSRHPREFDTRDIRNNQRRRIVDGLNDNAWWGTAPTNVTLTSHIEYSDFQRQKSRYQYRLREYTGPCCHRAPPLRTLFGTMCWRWYCPSSALATAWTGGITLGK